MLENSDQLREKALVTSPGKQLLFLSYLEIMVLIPKPGQRKTLNSRLRINILGIKCNTSHTHMLETQQTQ